MCNNQHNVKVLHHAPQNKYNATHMSHQIKFLRSIIFLHELITLKYIMRRMFRAETEVSLENNSPLSISSIDKYAQM